uniref:Uncharacterized protein n=1 Tax=Noctiluca scintillans TaxID=2966 RepID=A0A7S1F483_NOCSC
MERYPSLAPLCVRALRAVSLVLLRCPESLSESAFAEHDSDVSDDGEGDHDEAEGNAPDGAEVPDAAEPQEPEAEADGSEPDEKDETDAEDEKVKKKEDAVSDDDEEYITKEPDVLADGELVGGRQFVPSLLDLKAKDDVETFTSALPESGDVASATLWRSKMHWLITKLGRRARYFLGKPQLRFVRLISIFKFFDSFVETVPAATVLPLLESILNPVYRVVSSSKSTPVAVQSVEEALKLSPGQKREFLAQVAQACLQRLSDKTKEAGLDTQFALAIGNVRKHVGEQRATRAQRRKLLAVTEPEAFAKRKITKNRKNREGKKRKLDELIRATKGGRKVRKKASETLVA